MGVVCMTPRDKLPEDYGEAQRQFDMAHAAMPAANHAALASAVAAGAVVALVSQWYAAAVVVAAVAHWLTLRPYRARLKAAGDAWAAERRAYIEQLAVAD